MNKKQVEVEFVFTKSDFTQKSQPNLPYKSEIGNFIFKLKQAFSTINIELIELPQNSISKRAFETKCSRTKQLIEYQTEQYKTISELEEAMVQTILQNNISSYKYSSVKYLAKVVDSSDSLLNSKIDSDYDSSKIQIKGEKSSQEDENNDQEQEEKKEDQNKEIFDTPTPCDEKINKKPQEINDSLGSIQHIQNSDNYVQAEISKINTELKKYQFLLEQEIQKNQQLSKEINEWKFKYKLLEDQHKRFCS